MKWCNHCQGLVSTTLQEYYKEGKLVREEWACDKCHQVVLIHYYYPKQNGKK